MTTIAPDDAWAVGTIGCSDATTTLTEHWDGATWRIVKSPNPGGDGFNLLNKVTARGPDDVWAVGAWSDAGNEMTQPLVLHWDGTGWKQVHAPTGEGASCGDPGASLIGIGTDGSTLTAVGGRYCGQASRTLVESWNGHVWKVVPSPSPHLSDPPYAELGAVAVVGPTSSVAVGNTSDAAGNTVGMIEHTNGQRWLID